MVFKVAPIPQGASAASLAQWAKDFSWQVRPLKPLGPQAWLLGAETPPPPGWHAWNGQVVLVTAVTARQAQQPVVRAGKYTPGVANAETKPPESTDPWTGGDPWAQYLGRQATRASPPATQATTAPVPRNLDGPTEARFKTLEAAVAALQTSQTKTQDEIRQQAASSHQAVTHLRTEVQSLSSEFAKQLQLSVSKLYTAQTLQQTQVQKGMDELKALLLATCSSSGSQDAKRPRREGATEGEL